MALERPPKLGTTPDTDSYEKLKQYIPPPEKIARYHTVAASDTLGGVAKDIAQLPFWDYVDVIFPGCNQDPMCVNWYLFHRLGCPNTADGKNRKFKGGERLPIPYPIGAPPSTLAIEKLIEERAKLMDGFLKANSIITRDEWGALTSKIANDAKNLDWNYTTLVLHHSGPRGETDPKAIQKKHIVERGWDDVGYHFMIRPDGTIYEGRRLYYKGAHVESSNTGKLGVLVMGNFHWPWPLGREPTKSQLDTVNRFVPILVKLFPSIGKLGGHRDYGNTECPGDKFYPMLPGIRKSAGLIGP